MIESHINEGRQDVPPAGPSALKHGVSITDACVDWASTVKMLDQLDQVRSFFFFFFPFCVSAFLTRVYLILCRLFRRGVRPSWLLGWIDLLLSNACKLQRPLRPLRHSDLVARGSVQKYRFYVFCYFFSTHAVLHSFALDISLLLLVCMYISPGFSSCFHITPNLSEQFTLHWVT